MLTGLNMFSEEESHSFVFIDIQGFRAYAPTFILKEFCLVDGENIFHHIVKSPFSFHRLDEAHKKQALFLIKHHHGIRFDCGDISVRQLIKDIFPKLENKTILVKGLQKIFWLKELFKKEGDIKCLNIDDVISKWRVKAREEYETCEYHKHLYKWDSDICAHSIALKIQENYISHSVANQSTVDSDEKKNELV